MLRCARDDATPLLTFLEIMKKFIDTELDQDTDLFDVRPNSRYGVLGIFN